jgi:hypothetical protein
VDLATERADRQTHVHRRHADGANWQSLKAEFATHLGVNNRDPVWTWIRSLWSNLSMDTYVRFADETRAQRRTVLDALEVQRLCAGFSDDDVADIQVVGLRLPSNEVVGLVQILVASPSNRQISIVGLPAARQFRARSISSGALVSLEISLLDRATVDGRGNVTLADGSSVRSAQIIPVNLPSEPSDLDWKIVTSVISMLKGDQACYRDLAQGLPPEMEYAIPVWSGIDCAKLPGLNAPPLKQIAQHFIDLGVKPPSPPKIADALRRFGIRIPVGRRRAGQQHL